MNSILLPAACASTSTAVHHVSSGCGSILEAGGVGRGLPGGRGRGGAADRVHSLPDASVSHLFARKAYGLKHNLWV